MAEENTNTSPAAAPAQAAPAAQESSNTPEIVFSPVTAPEEQKSPELATTEPLTPLADLGLESGETVTKAAEAAPAAEAKPQSNDDLAAQLLQATARTEALERQVQALQPKKEPLTKPDITKYKDLEKYEEDLITYGKSLGQQESQTQSSQAAQDRKVQEVKAAVKGRDDVARGKYTDYDSVINSIVPILRNMPVLKEYIAENVNGSEVAYQLGKNPAMLQQLKTLSPIEQGRQIFALEARLKATAPVKQSDAPDPIKPVGNREGVRPTLGSLAEKDMNGYVAKRNKQELAALH